MIRAHSIRSAGVAAGFLLAAGCSPDTAGPTSHVDLVTVSVSITTTGFALDVDGYGLVIDGRPPIPVEPNSVSSIAFLRPPRVATFELTGIAEQCTIVGSERRVLMLREDSPEVSFQLECAGPDSFRTLRLVTSEWVRTDAIDLFEMTADGSARQRLTSDSGSFDPSVSFDATRIAFTRRNSGLHVLTRESGSVEQVTNDRGFSPSWSPDGLRIVYAVGDGWFTSDLRVVTLNGSEPEPFWPTGTDFVPMWSPDGSRIAFSRFGGTSSGLFISRVDSPGSTEQVADVGWSPVWAPAGDRILYGNNGGIGVIHLGTRTVEQVIASGIVRYVPLDWSSDGQWLLMTRHFGGSSHIVIRHAVDGRMYRITDTGTSARAAFIDVH